MKSTGLIGSPREARRRDDNRDGVENGMIGKKFDIGAAKAPLVLAVTGHRDLQECDIAKLTASVRQVWTELRSEFASTPFILLSPLAEGADRLVAVVALAPEMRTQLVVPLPMAEELYVKDFPDSVGEFETILGCHPKIELELKSSTPDEVAVMHSPARNRQYEEVGKYIVRECQILVALWDGQESQEIGSTAAVVGFQRRGLPPQAQDDLQPPELFPVYQIVTPHKRNPAPPDAFHCHKLYPKAFATPEEAENYYQKLFRNLKKFNNYIDFASKRFCTRAVVSRDRLMGGPAPFALSQSEEQNLGRYSVADAMAIRFQHYVEWVNWGLQSLVFLTFLALVLFAHWPKNPALALSACFVFFAIGLAIQWWAKRAGIDSRSQDYRAMAEACRVRFFWRIAGIGDGIADNYLGMQRTELDWIRSALRGWDVAPEELPQTELDKRFQFVRDRWVEEEVKFYRDREKRYEKKLKHGEIAMNLCLLAAVLIAGSAFLWHLLFHHEPSWLRCDICEHTMYWFVIPIDLFLAAGALLHHSLHRRALSQHIKQYKRMKTIFQKASELLQPTSDAGEVMKCLRKLGQEALKENGDWVLLHRERPLELPHP